MIWERNFIRTLFIIDGFGALLSAVAVGIVLPKNPEMMGMPAAILQRVALVPAAFVIYDLVVLLFQNNSLLSYLHVKAYLTLSYGLLTLVLAFLYISTFTFIGWILMGMQLAMIVSIAVYEIKVVAQEKHISESVKS